jgi:hypothetical protein
MEGSKLVSDINKRNLVYFEDTSMRALYACMDEWQEANQRRLLSLSIHADQGKYCCIALTNPTEVVITSGDGKNYAWVINGRLWTILRYPTAAKVWTTQVCPVVSGVGAYARSPGGGSSSRRRPPSG